MQHLIQCLNRHDIEQTDELLADIRRAVIKDQLSKPENTNALNEILNAVCMVFELDPKDIIGRRKYGRIPIARHMFAHLAREAGHSLCSIGLHIGGRHHSTIINSEQEAKNLIDTDEDFRWQVKQAMGLLSPTQ